MRDGGIDIVGGERFRIAADHVAKKLLGPGVVFLVHIDSRHVRQGYCDQIVVVAIDGTIDVNRTAESRLRFIKLIAH